MTVEDLIEQLKLLPPGAEVRIAYQPSWPLQVKLAGLAYQSPVDGEIYPAEDALTSESDHEDEQGIVFLVEGESPYDQPYAPRACWDVV